MTTIEIIILGIIFGIPYLAIGFFLALFAFDNPPEWIERSHLTGLIFVILMLIGPVILLGKLIWDRLTKNPKEEYLTMLSSKRPLTKEDYKKSTKELIREIMSNSKIENTK